MSSPEVTIEWEQVVRKLTDQIGQQALAIATKDALIEHLQADNGRLRAQLVEAAGTVTPFTGAPGPHQP